MTEARIRKIKLSIKKHRAILSAEKRKYGGFDDSAGRRYTIFDLYMQILDYKGVITYKKWFDKNFPDDIGSPLLSLYWSIAYFELGKIKESGIYTIDTALQNIYIHGLLLENEITRIDMYEHGYDMLKYAQSLIEDCRKNVTKKYMEWLQQFIETDLYLEVTQKYVELNKLLKDEGEFNKRVMLLKQIRELEVKNKLNA